MFEKLYFQFKIVILYTYYNYISFCKLMPILMTVNLFLSWVIQMNLKANVNIIVFATHFRRQVSL